MNVVCSFEEVCVRYIALVKSDCLSTLTLIHLVKTTPTGMLSRVRSAMSTRKGDGEKVTPSL